MQRTLTIFLPLNSTEGFQRFFFFIALHSIKSFNSLILTGPMNVHVPILSLTSQSSIRFHCRAEELGCTEENMLSLKR